MKDKRTFKVWAILSRRGGGLIDAYCGPSKPPFYPGEVIVPATLTLSPKPKTKTKGKDKT